MYDSFKTTFYEFITFLCLYFYFIRNHDGITLFTFRWNYWKTTNSHSFLVFNCESTLHSRISYDHDLRCQYQKLWNYIDYLRLCFHVSKEFRLQFIFISLIYNLFYISFIYNLFLYFSFLIVWRLQLKSKLVLIKNQRSGNCTGSKSIF